MTWQDAIEEIGAAVRRLEAMTIADEDLPDAAEGARLWAGRLGELKREWLDQAMQAMRDPESPVGPATFDEPPDDASRVANEPMPVGPTTKQPRGYTGAGGATVKTSRTAKRSYNTAAILVGIAEGEYDQRCAVHLAEHGPDGPTPDPPMTPVEALLYAVRGGVATVSWKWTPLKDLAAELGLPMRIVKREIADDGDPTGPWVGEVWTEKPKL